MFAVALGSSSAAVISLNVPATAATFVSFDAPSGTNTVPTAINNTGAIAGHFQFSDGSTAAFVRFPDGSFQTFKVKDSTTTIPSGINDKGFVSGGFNNPKKQESSCFQRNPNGRAILCGPLSAFAAEGNCINKSAVIGGEFLDDAGATHGFLWDRDNGATVFDVPGSALTAVLGLNDAGASTGQWVDAKHATRGFLREPDGTFTDVDVPGAVLTLADRINSAGVIAGSWSDGNTEHGFVRDAGGNFTVFDPRGSALTQVDGINKKGTVVGTWNDATGGIHGFERLSGGKIVSIDFPGTGVTTTFAVAINNNDDITGQYSDADGTHGYIRIP